MAKKNELAPGITVAEGGVVRVDPNVVYPMVLEAVGAPKEIDQYWAEVAYQCAKMEVQRLVIGTEWDPRSTGGVLRISVESSKDNWALDKFPVGKGAEEATMGRAARENYRQWRGFIPG